MNASYEEVRGAAIDILAGREKCSYPPSQYEHLVIGVEEVLARRNGTSSGSHGRPDRMEGVRDLFLEVFWDLFRQGIITLGCDEANREFPFCRLSIHGKKILASQHTYFFHDVTTYTERLRAEVPQVDDVTVLYVGESLQAFRAGCMLASTVMLGVATEHVFQSLLETVGQSSHWAPIFKTVTDERTVLQRLNKFKNILDQHTKSLPREVKEDLDTRFAGILSIIRTFRNDSGHPTGRLIDREQVYVLLNLFISYCKKMYELRACLV